MAVFANRLERRVLEHALTSHDDPRRELVVQPMHYGEFEMMDESPHTLKLKDRHLGPSCQRLCDSVQHCISDASSGGELALDNLQRRVHDLTPADSSLLKLMQVQTDWAMLGRLTRKTEGSPDAVSYAIVGGDQLNWLQAVDSCSAANTRRCQRNLRGGTLRYKACEQHYRGT